MLWSKLSFVFFISFFHFIGLPPWMSNSNFFQNFLDCCNFRWDDWDKVDLSLRSYLKTQQWNETLKSLLKNERGRRGIILLKSILNNHLVITKLKWKLRTSSWSLILCKSWVLGLYYLEWLTSDWLACCMFTDLKNTYTTPTEIGCV